MWEKFSCKHFSSSCSVDTDIGNVWLFSDGTTCEVWPGHLDISKKKQNNSDNECANNASCKVDHFWCDLFDEFVLFINMLNSHASNHRPYFFWLISKESKYLIKLNL